MSDADGYCAGWLSDAQWAFAFRVAQQHCAGHAGFAG
jgi:hypothetical protein